MVNDPRTTAQHRDTEVTEGTYGLQDTAAILLNAALLFVVLFYVYPLKFLFSFLIEKFNGGHGEVRLPNGNVVAMIENYDQMASLMIIFNLGYLAVFAVFVLLFWRSDANCASAGLILRLNSICLVS